MSIWFILFLISSALLTFTLFKIGTLKQSIKEITHEYHFIIQSDTNSLITLSSNDKDLKDLCICLNKDLKILRENRIRFEKDNQQLQSSITNISHDLRTPLTAIRGYLDLIDPKQLSQKNISYLNYIHEKTNELTALTEQLFEFTKTLDQSLNKKEVCLNSVLENVLCGFYDLFLENHIEPSIDITNHQIIRCLDENMLKRIFENILSNVVKYSEKECIIKLTNQGVMEFSNRAPHLDKTTVEKIFNRYYTVENAKKSTGIGLSIAKQLVELNDGKISAIYENGFLKITVQF